MLIFAGLTAYDTQRLKEQYCHLRGTEFAGKAIVLGALSLYLDFINMFQFLLSFMGQRTDARLIAAANSLHRARGAQPHPGHFLCLAGAVGPALHPRARCGRASSVARAQRGDSTA